MQQPRNDVVVEGLKPLDSGISEFCRADNGNPLIPLKPLDKLDKDLVFCDRSLESARGERSYHNQRLQRDSSFPAIFVHIFPETDLDLLALCRVTALLPRLRESNGECNGRRPRPRQRSC